MEPTWIQSEWSKLEEAWYLLLLVVLDEGEKGLFGEKYSIFACSKTNPKPYTVQITEIAPYMRTYL